MPSSNENTNEQVAEMLHTVINRLPTKIRQRLIDHPDVVANALTVAATTIATVDTAQYRPVERLGQAMPLQPISSARAAAEAKRHVVTDPGELLNSTEFARKAGLNSRQTLHAWVKKGRIIAWEGAKRGLQLPAQQLDARGQSIPHVEALHDVFADPYTLWVWLSTPAAALQGERPMDVLRQHNVGAVVAAATGAQQGDFG